MEQAGDIKTFATPYVVVIDRSIVSTEALLKTCYWFSRDYLCEIINRNELIAEVTLTPRQPVHASDLISIKETFISSAMDFALREKIDAKTSDIRDLLLAKAFSESGILEDHPEGIFGDSVEESKPNSMFRILDNSRR
jgi:His-Xaa-Ser system protein HxsD